MTKFKVIKDFVREFVKGWKDEGDIDAFTYFENLYCPNCGEDEELDELGTYGGYDEYQCESCNEIFQTPSINK